MQIAEGSQDIQIQLGCSKRSDWGLEVLLNRRGSRVPVSAKRVLGRTCALQQVLPVLQRKPLHRIG